MWFSLAKSTLTKEAKTMKVAYCRANNVKIAEWQEQRCRLKNCPWLVYVCDSEVNKNEA